jgi:hypothetical protein
MITRSGFASRCYQLIYKDHAMLPLRGMCGHSRDQVIMNIHTVRLGLFTLQ